MGRRQFSREFKLEAVKLVKERGVSVAQAARDQADISSDCITFENEVSRLLRYGRTVPAVPLILAGIAM